MIADRRTSWILNGELVHVLPESPGAPVSEMEYIGRKGAVKIVETSEGVEIKWMLFAANWASLYYLAENLHLYTGPFTLRYFLSGWFTETIESPLEVKMRIEQLIAKSDIHLVQHIFVKQVDPAKSRVPHILRDTLSDMKALPEFSVDCVYDEDSNEFVVQRVGSQSSIARLYGVSPVTTLCLTGNTYDEVVSAAYASVLEDEEPYYDHVIAAMVLPDHNVSWIPYQRVILPHRFPDGRRGVSVVSDLVDVDIKIV